MIVKVRFKRQSHLGGMTEEAPPYKIKSKELYADKTDYKAYKPKEVGNFSISKDGNFVHCNEANVPSLNKTLQFPVDLNVGYYKDWVSDYTSEWDKILEWVNGNTGALSDVDVVAQRGVLKDIGYTIQNYFKNSWTFEACKCAGILYIRKVDEQQSYSNDRGRQNSYWGKKFEELFVEQDPEIKASYRMLKAGIESKRVLLSAEVDAKADNGQYTEVKTCFSDQVAKKIPQTWLQSYLGKINVIHFAFKDEQGKVNSKPQQHSMSKKVGSSELPISDANAMIGFLSEVIEWMHDSIPDGDYIWRMEYEGKDGIRKMEYEGKDVITLTRYQEGFLPSWYLKIVSGTASDADNTANSGK